MAIYTMSQIETLTGINAHSLRVWERRYSFLTPLRTDTNIRYYNDEHLKKLLNISILTRNGYRISSIDTMTSEMMDQLVYDILKENSESKYKDQISALVISMLEFNENAFEKIFQRSVIRDGFLDTITDLIYPFLQLVGVMWTSSKAVPAQEHFISNLIRQKIISSTESLPEPSDRAHKIILFLPESEYHEMGLLLAQYIAKFLSWKVYYLGQNVPSDDVNLLHSVIDSDIILSIITSPNQKTVNERFKPILENSKTCILVSGPSVTFQKEELSSGLTELNHPKELIDILENFDS